MALFRPMPEPIDYVIRLNLAKLPSMMSTAFLINRNIQYYEKYLRVLRFQSG